MTPDGFFGSKNFPRPEQLTKQQTSEETYDALRVHKIGYHGREDASDCWVCKLLRDFALGGSGGVVGGE